MTMKCGCPIEKSQARINDYRSLMAQYPELKDMYRELLRDEQRWNKKVLDMHDTICLGNHYKLIIRTGMNAN